jgi:bifunctional ADP-heptose synthase (sugar kinase/adenylyltransferase)
MEYTYTYIIAPNTANNFTILLAYMQAYTEVVQEHRLKTIYKRNENDIVTESEDGISLLVPADAQTYVLLKALSSEFQESMLQGVTDYEIYNKDTLPFNTFWL